MPKSPLRAKILCFLLTLVLTVAVLASWVFNMGWMRVILTWCLVPVFHTVFVWFTNLLTLKYTCRDGKALLWCVLFNLSWLVAYVSFPDVGDIGKPYVFFHLLETDQLTPFFLIAWVALIVHVASFVLLLIRRKGLQYETSLRL